MSLVAADLQATPPAAHGHEALVRTDPAWVRHLVWLPLVPAVASLLAAWAQGWVPIADGAVAAVRSADIWRGHVPLLGMPASISEFTPGPQRYHPGPLLFWGLAPFTLVFGAQVGAAVGAVAINTGAAMGAIAATARAGSRRLTVLVTGAVLVTEITVWGPGHLYDPFNTMLPATALLLVFVLAWRLACGDGAVLPWAVLVASFCIQTHVVYALPIVVALGPAAAIALGPSRWRPAGSSRPSTLRVATSLALGLLLWAGPVIDALGHGGGNLRLLVSGTDGTPVIGLPGFLASITNTFTLPPSQFTDISSGSFLRWPNLSTALTVAVAVWAVRRARSAGQPELLRLIGIAALSVVGAGITTALLPDEPLKNGQMTFFKVVVPFVWVALIGSLVATWRVDRAHQRAWNGLALGAITLITLISCVPFQIRNGHDPDSWLFDATPALASQIDHALPADRPIRMDASGGARYLLLQYGLMAALDAKGREIGVLEARRTNFDDRRLMEDGPTVITLHVQPPEVARPPNGHLIARFRPEVDARARRRLEAELLRRARAHGSVQLTSNGRNQLGATLLGRPGIDEAEIHALQRDPSRLLRLPAADVAAIYRNSWVIEPALPGDLWTAYVRLLGPSPVDVWAVSEAPIR